MSFRAKRELLVQVAPRYLAARHGQRSVILDEFVAVTGYERKYAIRLLLGPIRPPEPIRRARVGRRRQNPRVTVRVTLRQVRRTAHAPACCATRRSRAAAPSTVRRPASNSLFGCVVSHTPTRM